jgi:hypothetical protein
MQPPPAPLFRLAPDSIVYFVAPAAYASGGPEAIHRVCGKLRSELGIDARILYLPASHPDPVHPAYRDLRIPRVEAIADDPNHVLVVTEYFNQLQFAAQFQRLRIVIWWLSIDFFYSSYWDAAAGPWQRRLLGLEGHLRRRASGYFPNLLEARDRAQMQLRHLAGLHLAGMDPIGRAAVHLCQSAYAKAHLAGKGLERLRELYDLTDSQVLEATYDPSAKEDLILYNPKKGELFSREIIARAPQLRFVPLVNLGRTELLNLLRRAKVYIDFGNHPGRDRLPREAALFGCCVLTGTRGSAAFREDLPLPARFKIEDKRGSLPSIVATLQTLIDDYARIHPEYDPYRHFIREQDRLVTAQLRAIFEPGTATGN